MRRTILAVTIAGAVHVPAMAQSSAEKSCILTAAAKLPNIPGLTISASRATRS
jgi:hypothetical protein